MDTPTSPATPTGMNGPVIGIVVVIIALIAAAFVFFGRLSPQNDEETASTTPAATTTTGTENFAPTATSDDVSAIDKDLQAENFNSIDADLSNVDKELSQ